MSSTRDPWERLVSLQRSGIYESNYLKANSPCGRRGIWLKHNLLRPHNGEGLAEFWAILFEQGSNPIVVKKEVPWKDLRLSEVGIGIGCDQISMVPEQAIGQIAKVEWKIRMRPNIDADPLHHLRWDWMYTAGFPKKKVLTPAPNLQFDGEIRFDDTRWPIDKWIGMRGHNWGTEHAWQYAYGNCHLWDQNDLQRDHPSLRTVDGFSAKIRLPGGATSPWLNSIVSREPDHELNRLSNWFGGATVTPTRWTLATGGCKLEMDADPTTYVGLRYAHPGGAESYCYNTKFAAVSWQTPSGTFTSNMGELEVLFDKPLPTIPLHPTPDWDPTCGDYVG